MLAIVPVDSQTNEESFHNAPFRHLYQLCHLYLQFILDIALSCNDDANFCAPLLPCRLQLLCYPYLKECQYGYLSRADVYSLQTGEECCVGQSGKYSTLEARFQFPKFHHGRTGCKLLNLTSGMVTCLAEWSAANTSQNLLS